MYDLGINRLLLKVPTRIYEHIEEDPMIRRITQRDREKRIDIELEGVKYSCSFDHSTKLVDALEALEKGKELIKPDYVDRWNELTSNQETVERYIILAPYADTLGVTAIGLDPNDSKHFFIKVAGRHRTTNRN